MGIGIPHRPPPLRPPGAAKGPKFAALQLGARALQSSPGLDPDAAWERRQQLLDRAHPQRGVDALASEFSGTTPIPGVREAAPGHGRDEAPGASPAPRPDRDG
ncbi:hypothetical protein HMPREF3159_09230 [Brachybacterium sp. HMSC06H03]|uniref:hypothetical protein n=1 Tax=Brachybacterium sp. HMSC06H03 TaxID=1581127 RepID=UPI0008A3AFE9|nr:hypothetical protein [Brachybacterium sp. HMSC06H03]OFT56399.1 hypothetical protein HMPREF3159_09230 [Brachybacterium sp. HMSC06H03]